MRRLAPIASVVLSGCGPQSIFSPAGPYAESLSSLTWAVLITFLAVTAVMFVLIVWAVLRRRGTFEEHLPWNAGGGIPWILIGGFAVPAVILGVFLVLGLVTMRRFPLHDPDDHVAEIHVVGHQWWWEVHYLGESPHERVTTANEIHIPVGVPIDVKLTTGDVIHSFWVPKLGGKVDLIPGHENWIRLHASEPGVYEGRCAEYCGAQHTRMRLLVVAEPVEAYERWLLNQKRPASVPTSDMGVLGQKLFVSRACGLCHTIRGTHARGTVGPDLTHLATRRRIGANSYPNDHAWLQAWATRAQALKPEIEMPNVTDFTGVELRALTEYLLQLR